MWRDPLGTEASVPLGTRPWFLMVLEEVPMAIVGTPSWAARVGDGRAGRVAGAGGGVGDRERQARDRAGHPAPGGEVFRRGDELVSRFQFVADHRHAFEVKRLCEIVQIARSSFTPGWAPPRHALPAQQRTRSWPTGSALLCAVCE